MPSRTPKQARFMKAVANNPKFADKVGVPPSVGEEFVKADKRKGTKLAGVGKDKGGRPNRFGFKP